MDFSGFVDYVVTLNTSTALEGLSVSLVLPMAPKNAQFSLGLGRKGGLLSNWFNKTNQEKNATTEWKWDGVNGNNALWLGSAQAGLRVFPKGESDEWQAAVPFDSKSTPPTPEEWSNSGTGGILVSRGGSVTVYTGKRNVPAGESLVFRFSLLITPTRPLNLTKHFRERHYQSAGPVNYTTIAAGGATIVNVHQGNVLNPWINYPYATNTLMAQASKACHAAGMRFKIYNTMRELSYKAKEMWAMRSLNETYVNGPEPQADGVGSPWLQEHLQGDYQVAWSNAMEQPIDQGSDMWWSQQEDHAVKVKALSRWNNYYVQGNLQMQKDFNFDGVYLDEIAYDRITMLRTKAVLGEKGLIDHHCDIGAFCTSCAANYMELYPFIDSLWYGEGFNYEEATPDYWLAEISGLMLGLPSEMLRYKGMTPMHFRGLAHASTNRWQHSYTSWAASPDCPEEFAVSPSCDPFDPRDVWALQSAFGIVDSQMIGWWAELEEEAHSQLPAASNVEAVKVTTYVRKGKSALIVLANFGSQPTSVTLTFNWTLLGLDASTATLSVPKLRVPVQLGQNSISMFDPIKVPALTHGAIDSVEGVILLLEKKGPSTA